MRTEKFPSLANSKVFFIGGKDLKTKILSILVLLSLLVIAIPSAAFAADPTTVFSVDWNGAGNVNGVATVGSGWNGAGTSWVQSSFSTGGSNIVGGYDVTTTGKQTYDNWGDMGPYSVSAIDASAVGGGISFSNARTGVTPYGLNQHYPDVGQVVTAYASTGLGAGSVDFDLSSISQYAGMANTSGGFNANASSYILNNVVTSGTGNSARFDAAGNGIANIDCWHTDAGNGVNFGWGQGCYTDADVNNTGSGVFSVGAVYTNGLQTEKTGANGAYTGWNLGGAGTYLQGGTYTNGATVPNFSLSAW